MPTGMREVAYANWHIYTYTANQLFQDACYLRRRGGGYGAPRCYYQELRTTTLFFLAVVFVLGSIAGPAVMQDSIMPTGNNHNMRVGMLLRTCQWY